MGEHVAEAMCSVLNERLLIDGTSGREPVKVKVYQFVAEERNSG